MTGSIIFPFLLPRLDDGARSQKDICTHAHEAMSRREAYFDDYWMLSGVLCMYL